MEPKPSYKSLEFWVGLAAAIFGGLLTAGIIAPDNIVVQIIGAVLSAFGVGGVLASRTMIKMNAAKLPPK